MPQKRKRGYDHSRSRWIVALWGVLALAIAGVVLWANRSALPPIMQWAPNDESSGLLRIRYPWLDLADALLSPTIRAAADCIRSDFP